MTKIISEDEKHALLSSAYSELVNGRNQISMTTRAAARAEPTSVYAKSHTCTAENRSTALKVILAKC